LKGCSCDDIPTGAVILPYPAYTPVSQAQIDAVAWEIFQDMFDGNLALLDGSEGNPSSSPTCSNNSASGVPSELVTNSGNATPNQLLYSMREVLCNNQCVAPTGIPDAAMAATPDGDGCEIAIAIPDNVEAYAYRGTGSQGLEWQDCWDSLANITEQCVRNGPNVGWVNGPNIYEFFQTGFRPINGAGNRHPNKTLSSDSGLKDGSAPVCDDNNKPSCDSCIGGANQNTCTTGAQKGCSCTPNSATQPPPPKVTNCATAVAASEIICCGWSQSTWPTCSGMITNCGVIPNLNAICQSAIWPSQTYKVCGQSSEDQAVVKNSAMEGIFTCLDKAFGLNANSA